MMGPLPLPPMPPSKATMFFTAEGPFKQVPLPYASDKNEPHIDKMTMEIRHGRGDVTCMNNLNDAAKDNADVFSAVQDLITNVQSAETLALSFATPVAVMPTTPCSGGCIGRSGGAPSGEIAKAINDAFGEFGKLGNLNAHSTGRVQDRLGRSSFPTRRQTSLVTTPNQDKPDRERPDADLRQRCLGTRLLSEVCQNRHASYMKSSWRRVNWDVVNKRYADAKAGKFAFKLPACGSDEGAASAAPFFVP